MYSFVLTLSGYIGQFDQIKQKVKAGKSKEGLTDVFDAICEQDNDNQEDINENNVFYAVSNSKKTKHNEEEY